LSAWSAARRGPISPANDPDKLVERIEVRLPLASFAFPHDAGRRAVAAFDQAAEQFEWAFLTATSDTKDERFKAAAVLLADEGVGSFNAEDARIFEPLSLDSGLGHRPAHR
jgi:hypothetical protein